MASDATSQPSLPAETGTDEDKEAERPSTTEPVDEAGEAAAISAEAGDESKPDEDTEPDDDTQQVDKKKESCFVCKYTLQYILYVP